MRIRSVAWRGATLRILFLSLIATSIQAETLKVSLADGLRMAFDKNELLHVARGELEKASHGVREALSNGLPQIDANMAYNRNWRLPSTVFDTPTGRERITIGTKNNFTGNLTLRQRLYGGGVAAEWREARRFEDLSREGLRETRQDVQAAVETAFYDLLLAKELGRVNVLALERARRNFRQVDLLRQAGRASRFDLLRAEVQVLELLPDSIRAYRDLKLAEVAFKNVIGMDHSKDLKPVGGFRKSTSVSLESAESLIESGLSQRPDLRKFGHRQSMARQNIRIQQSGYLPTFDLVVTGQLQVFSNDFDIQEDDFRRSWFSGISMRMPLFNGLRTPASVARARIDLRRSELETESLERRARLEIRSAWLTHREANDRETAQTRASELTREGVRIAQVQYAEGLITQLEVTDAQLSLLRAETELARAKRDKAVALVEIERAVGVLGEKPKY